MPTDEFVRFALYHPKHGYYTSDTRRVGKGRILIFIPQTLTGKLWGELIIEACSEILGAEQIKKHSFVEIAAEPNCSILKGIDTPFNLRILLGWVTRENPKQISCLLKRMA